MVQLNLCVDADDICDTAARTGHEQNFVVHDEENS